MNWKPIYQPQDCTILMTPAMAGSPTNPDRDKLTLIIPGIDQREELFIDQIDQPTLKKLQNIQQEFRTMANRKPYTNAFIQTLADRGYIIYPHEELVL